MTFDDQTVIYDAEDAPVPHNISALETTPTHSQHMGTR